MSNPVPVSVDLTSITFFVHKPDGGMESSTDPFRRDYVTYQDFNVIVEQLLEARLELKHYESQQHYTDCVFSGELPQDLDTLSDEEFGDRFELSDDCKCQGCWFIRYILSLRKRAANAVVWREVAESLHEEDKCHYDHHNFCQTHSLHSWPCPHDKIKQLLAASK